MEVAFIVYSDGSIFESDITTGQILRQIQNIQFYSVSSTLIDTISNNGDPLSSTSSLFIQNKSSTKSSILSCFDNNNIIEVFTPASTLGGTTITCVSVSKCGNWLFRGLQNGSILVTHLRPSIQQNTSSKNSSGKPQLSHRIIQTSHIGPITCIATNTTGWIATSSEDRSIIVSPLSQFLKLDSTSVQQNSNIEIKLQGHTLPVTDMYFTSDSRLISVSRDQTLKVWDVFSKTKLCNISFPSALTCLAVSPTETTAYVGAKDGNIYKVNFVNIKEHDSDFRMNLEENNDSKDRAYCYIGNNQSVTSVRLTLDCTKLVSTYLDGSIITWDESTCQKLCIINPHKVSAVWCQIFLKPSFQSHGKRKRDFNEKSISSTVLNESIIPMTSQCTNSEFIEYFCDEIKDSPLKTFVEPVVSEYMLKISHNLFTETFNFAQTNYDDLIEENEKLKLKVEELQQINAKWKTINNELYKASLNKFLK